MKDRVVGHLSFMFLDRCVMVDWRRLERGKRWRLVLGEHPIWFPPEMPPRRKGRLFRYAFAWYPKHYEP